MTPSGQTAAHAALTALAGLATLNLGGVQVLDGPIGATDLSPDVLIVGWSEGSTPSVVISRGETDMGGRQREDGDLVCVLDCYRGDDNFAVLRARAAEILGGLEAALSANAGLGGVVDAAWFGEAMEWTQRNAADGSTVRVGFAVHYVAEL